MIKKFKLDTPCTIGIFKEHKQIKNNLISLIKKTNSDTLKTSNDYFNDLIHRLDWDKSKDAKRKWVKYLIPYLQKYFNEIANKLGYQEVDIKNLWFQQYNLHGKHGWHTHGSTNFANVYFLECPRGSSTKFRNFTEDCEEGDILSFPAFLPHMSPPIENDEIKTVIAFNSDFEILEQQ